MSENKISKPDANPMVAAVLTYFVCNSGHIIVNGQQRKWIFTLVASLVGVFCCLLPGIVLGILSTVEAYQTAQRLQNGEEVGENEYTNALLFKIIRMMDKTATCAGVDTAE